MVNHSLSNPTIIEMTVGRYADYRVSLRTTCAEVQSMRYYDHAITLP